MASGMTRLQRLRAWLSMWQWRAQETLSVRLPGGHHRWLCPFCRGWDRYFRDLKRQERA